MPYLMQHMGIRLSALAAFFALAFAPKTLPAADDSKSVAVTQVADSAQWVSDDIPNAMSPGASQVVHATIKNTGSNTWYWIGRPDETCLAMTDTLFGTKWGGTIAPNTTVAPGGEYAFEFTITAPETLGPYNLNLTMFHRGVGAFSPFPRPITVDASPTSPQVWYPNGYVYVPAGGAEPAQDRLFRARSLKYQFGYDISAPSMHGLCDPANGIDVFAAGQVGMEFQVVADGVTYNSARRIPLKPGELATALKIRETGKTYTWCHIKDIRLAAEDGSRAPVTAELYLYCWNDRIICDARIQSAKNIAITSSKVRMMLSSSAFSKIHNAAGAQYPFGTSKQWPNTVKGLTFTGSGAGPCFGLLFPDTAGLSSVQSGSASGGAYLDINIAGTQVTTSTALSCAYQMRFDASEINSRKAINAEYSPLTANQIQVTGSSSGKAAFSSPAYNPKTGCYQLTIPWAHGWEYYFNNQNEYETANVSIEGDSYGRQIKLSVLRDIASKPASEAAAWGEQWVGFVTTDSNGNPTDMTMQGANINCAPVHDISQHWIGHTEFPLSASQKKTFITKLVPKSWGRKPGMRNYTEDQLTYDPYGQVFFNLTSSIWSGCSYFPMNQNEIPSLGDNFSIESPFSQAGGGEFVKYKIDGAFRRMNQGRIRYLKSGPNMTHTLVDNLTDDGAISVQHEIIMFPSGDNNRQLYRIRGTVIKTVNIGSIPANFRFFSLGDERYGCLPNHQKLAFMNQYGTMQNGVAMSAYTGVQMRDPATGDSWVVEYGAAASPPRGFILRKFNVTIGGSVVTPCFTVQPGPDDGDGGMRSRIILTANSGATALNPGDKFDVEVMVDVYGSPSSDYSPIQADASSFGSSTGVSVTMNAGTLVEDLPVHVALGSGGNADFTMSGGKNYLPIVVDGFTGYVDGSGNGPVLQEMIDDNWVAINQGPVNGNDFWEIDKDPMTGAYSVTFLVLTEGNSRRFRAGFPGNLPAYNPAPPALRGEFQPGVYVPVNIDPGRNFTASITVKNTGTSNWVGGTHKLRGLTEMGEMNIDHAIPVGTTITPGNSYTFTWQTCSPETPGFYLSKWQMYGGNAPFGTPVIRDMRCPARTDNAKVISDTLPATMTKGQVQSVSITLKNIGTTTWKGSDVADRTEVLMTDSTFGPQWNGASIPSGQTVAPGNQYTFTFNITAPSTAGKHDFNARAVHQGIGLLGPAIAKSIQVN